MSPESKASATSSLEQRISVALHKLSLALKHQAWQGAGPRGLSPTQGQILAALVASPLRPSSLSERLAVSPPTISDSVRVLVDKGLLERERDHQDARATVLRLTDAGREEAARCLSWPDFLGGALEPLSSEERASLLAMLLKIIRTLQLRGQIPLSAMCLTCQHFRPRAHADARAPHHCALVDAPLGNGDLRLDCPDHTPASPAAQEAAWALWLDAPPGSAPPPGLSPLSPR